MPVEDKKDPLTSAISKATYNYRGMYSGAFTPEEILALFKAGATDYFGHTGERSDYYVCALMRKKAGIGGHWNFLFHSNGINMGGKETF